MHSILTPSHVTSRSRPSWSPRPDQRLSALQMGMHDCLQAPPQSGEFVGGCMRRAAQHANRKATGGHCGVYGLCAWQTMLVRLRWGLHSRGQDSGQLSTARAAMTEAQHVQLTPYSTPAIANSPRTIGQRPSQKETPSWASLEARGIRPCTAWHTLSADNQPPCKQMQGAFSGHLSYRAKHEHSKPVLDGGVSVWKRSEQG